MRNMSKINSTPKQKKVFDFIKSYTTKNKYPPTYEEIKKYMKYKNVGTVAQAVNHLRNKGYISFTHGVPRSINILQK